MTEVPVPVAISSGSAGTQEATPAGINPPVVAEILPQHAMTSAVVGIATDRSHALGGQNTAALISGYATMMHAELQTTKLELADVREELKRTQISLSDEESKVKVLESEKRSGGGVNKFQLLGVTVGGFLFTAAIEVYKSGAEKLAVGIGAMGLLLILVGWVWAFRSDE